MPLTPDETSAIRRPAIVPPLLGVALGIALWGSALGPLVLP
ncbi:MAG: hypothetical protein OXH70_14760 [Acidobacteria bacterium]|nr:hypothetical protein [Acidobacteriota bacterium]MDE2976377.1 hypothetical protein [Acidobacteriota bacterium]